MSKFFKIIVWSIAFPVVFGCATTAKSNQVDLDKVEVPDEWVKRDAPLFHVISPEGDLKIYFETTEIDNLEDFSQFSKELWRRIDPTFNFKEKDKASRPNSGGWDEIIQIFYETPAEAFKVVGTLLRVKDGVGYINLITSSLSTVNKRQTQISTIIDEWKPDSIRGEDYSNVQAKEFSDIEQDFNSFLEETQNKLNVPGFGIGIIQNGKVVFKKGYGVRKVGNPDKIDSGTLFMIGSITKPLVTLMTSKLVYDGHIGWDDKISDHLKGWKLKNNADTDRMLMKHSACACTGMPRRDLDVFFEFDGVSPELRMKQMATMSPTTKAGETFQYSNMLVAAGGYSASQAYKPNLNYEDSFEQAMKDLVFNPLEMDRTMVSNTKPYVENSAFPHSLNLEMKPELVPLKLEEFVESVAPAGSVWSNIDDMLNYLNFELGNANLQKYLPKEAHFERRKKMVKISEDSGYGLGLFVEKYNGVDILGHVGNTMGFTSDMFFLPNKNVGVVLLTNLGGANTFRSVVKDKLLELLFGMDNKVSEEIDFHLTEYKKDIAKFKDKIKNKIENPENFIGNFQSAELGKMKVSRQGRKLIADFGEFKGELVELENVGSKRVFTLMSSPWFGSFEFIWDKDHFLLDEAQTKYIFKKK